MFELTLSETKQVLISEEDLSTLGEDDLLEDLPYDTYWKYRNQLGDIWNEEQNVYQVRVYTDRLNKIVVNDYFNVTYQCDRTNILDMGDRILFKIEQDQRICVMTKDSLILYKYASEYDKPLDLIGLNQMKYNKVGLFSR